MYCFNCAASDNCLCSEARKELRIKLYRDGEIELTVFYQHGGWIQAQINGLRQ